MSDTCPLMQLNPVRDAQDVRTLQLNFQKLVEWNQLLCAYIATLEARIAALEP